LTFVPLCLSNATPWLTELQNILPDEIRMICGSLPCCTALSSFSLGGEVKEEFTSPLLAALCSARKVSSFHIDLPVKSEKALQLRSEIDTLLSFNREWQRTARSWLLCTISQDTSVCLLPRELAMMILSFV